MLVSLAPTRVSALTLFSRRGHSGPSCATTRSPSVRQRPSSAKFKRSRRRADAAQNLSGRRRHDRRQHHRGETYCLSGIEQDLRQPIRLRRILRQGPRCGRGDEFIGAVDQPECRRRAFVQREAIHRRAVLGNQRFAEPRELVVPARRRCEMPAAGSGAPSTSRG